VVRLAIVQIILHIGSGYAGLVYLSTYEAQSRVRDHHWDTSLETRPLEKARGAATQLDLPQAQRSRRPTDSTKAGLLEASQQH